MKIHSLVLNSIMLSILVLLSSRVVSAAAPKINLQVGFYSPEETRLDITIIPSASAESCSYILKGATQKWQARWNERMTKLGVYQGSSDRTELVAENLNRLKLKGRATSRLFFRAWVRCPKGAGGAGGKKRKRRSPVAQVVLLEGANGTVANKRKWLKQELKGKLVDMTVPASPTPTPTAAPPGAAWALWQQSSAFRGANMVAWGDAAQKGNYNLMTAQDFVNLKATGANLVQLSVHGTRKVKSPYEVNTTKQTELDNLTKWAQDAGLYYIIAVRRGPGRRDVAEEDDDPSAGCSTVWTDAAAQTAYGQMLAEMVQRYNHDLLVGINLTVEPNLFTCPTEQADSPQKLKTLMDNNSVSLKSIYEGWIAAIRQVDADLPIGFQVGGWSDPRYWDVNYAEAPPSDPYVFLDVHNYMPWGLTHEGACNWPGSHYDPESDDDAAWNKARLEHYFQYVSAYQQQYSVPVFLGEFGIDHAACSAGTTARDYLKDEVDIVLGHGWHLAIWGWNNDSIMGLNVAPENVKTLMYSVFDGSYQPGS
jgi:hypothetical protein